MSRDQGEGVFLSIRNVTAPWAVLVIIIGIFGTAAVGGILVLT